MHDGSFSGLTLSRAQSCSANLRVLHEVGQCQTALARLVFGETSKLLAFSLIAAGNLLSLDTIEIGVIRVQEHINRGLSHGPRLSLWRARCNHCFRGFHHGLVIRVPAGLASVVTASEREAACGQGISVVKAIDLEAADVRVLAVLVVLEHHHAQHHAPERVAILAATGAAEGYILPALGVGKRHVSEGKHVMLRRARKELHAGRSVRLVGAVVDIEANGANLNPANELHRKTMRLGTIRPVFLSP